MTDHNRISQLINNPSPEPSGSAPPSTTQAPSTPPTSTAPPAGGGSGSGEVRNSPDDIDGLANQLLARIGPKLQQAAADIGGMDLAESSYTAVTYPLAIAYTEASAFMIKDLGAKVDRLAEIGYGLKTNAALWREAEDSSTVHGA